MATLLEEGYENGADGGTITSANTAWGTVSDHARFSSAHAHSGALSSTAEAGEWSATYEYVGQSNPPQASGSLWFYHAFGDFFASGTPVLELDFGPAGGDSGTTVLTVTIGAGDLTVDAIGAEGESFWGAPAIFPAGGWHRIEWSILPDGTAQVILTPSGGDAVTLTTVPLAETGFHQCRVTTTTMGADYQQWVDDVAITATAAEIPAEEKRVTRQWPRDDEYGLGSAPRLVPPPRGGRLVGGYM